MTLAQDHGPRSSGLKSVSLVKPWHSRLPNISQSEADLSRGIGALPRNLLHLANDAFRKTLARYTSTEAAQVSITAERVWEDKTYNIFQGRRRCVFVSLTLQHSARVTFEIGADFTIALVARILGETDCLDVNRTPSRGEQAILEFLFIEAAHNINLTLGHSLIQIEEVSLESPGWLFQAQQKRALAASLFVDLQCVAGHVLTYLSSDFCKVSTEISRKFAGTQLSTKTYSAVTRDVALNLIIGETDLALNELKHLEVGDVVILRQPCGYWSDSRRELRVRLGDGDSLFLEGVVDESGETGMKVIVKNVVSVDQPAESYGGPMENELPGKKIFGDDSELIDGLLLTVRVEMSARRVRLDEIAQFREGQILPLGCRASDPVDLIVDGKRIAQGELVEIDGQLGVSLKQVALGT